MQHCHTTLRKKVDLQNTKLKEQQQSTIQLLLKTGMKINAQ